MSPTDPKYVLAEHLNILAEQKGKLEEKSRFFEALLRGLPGIFYVFDEKLKLVLWNENAEAVTGYSQDDLKQDDLLEMITEADRRTVLRAIRGAFATGFGVTEARMTTKDGRAIPYFFTGQSTRIDDKAYLVGMGLDMSPVKQAESALKESEALYHLFAERMTEGVMLFTGPKILFVNRAFCDMCGYESMEELMKVKPLDLAAESYTIYFRELYDALAAGLAQERFFQARWKKKDGAEIWVEGRGNRIFWKEKPSIIITVRDITEAKEKELSMKEEAEQLRRENVNLRSSIKDRYKFGDIIGKSPAMQKVYELVLNAAATSANVIIYGESGTGKELVARAIHLMSSRSKNDFVPVNCAAIPENLLESEFFGHKKGAFTGAHTDKHGFLDLADAGTLFLDEVGELTPVLQVKLLRAIEGGGYTPVGSNATKTSNFRIIAATNRNLMDLCRKGQMREDFFFRIHIIPITIPPLRQRKDDIPLLVEHFLRVYSPDKKFVPLPGQVMEALSNYDWPGNVRELQNVIQRYLTVKRLDFLTPQALGGHSGRGAEPSPAPSAFAHNPAANPAYSGEDEEGQVGLRDATQSVEKNVIQEALDQNRWNKSRTALALGISRKTLFRKMQQFGLI
ncbi:MAG: sigma-54-dependent Fis family transcriptional regulator [Deltaproteobacteria bacterium]|nr:sigma-54-dependent Fis family transcriptional regulator [Deltaproteobacteria bacterium]